MCHECSFSLGRGRSSCRHAAWLGPLTDGVAGKPDRRLGPAVKEERFGRKGLVVPGAIGDGRAWDDRPRCKGLRPLTPLLQAPARPRKSSARGFREPAGGWATGSCSLDVSREDLNTGRTGKPTLGTVTNEQLALITSDPLVLHGQARVAGTRISVRIVLDCLAAGMTEAEILAEYPSLTAAGIRAAASFGAPPS